MKYIDSHAHYLSGRFAKDRDILLNNLLKNDLEYIIECGTNTKSNQQVIELCKKYKNIYGVIGYFPMDVQELENAQVREKFIEQLKNDKVLAIGEIGLDYYHKGDKELQKKWFKEQLKIAKSLNLPVCIHSRDAEEDTLSILRNNGKMNGVIHCYSYGVKTMKELLKLGYYFGVGGTCTYLSNKDLREAIRQMPLERIVLETDCPYLSPNIVRKERNNSENIKYVISELSELKKVSKNEIIEQTNKNVKVVYSKLMHV